MALGLLAACSDPAAPLVDAQQSTVLLDRDVVVADGLDAAVLTITLRTNDGAPVPGVAVGLVAPPDVTFTPLSPTNQSGQTTSTITSTIAETKMLSVEIAGQEPLTLEVPPVTFTAGPVTKLMFVSQPMTSELGTALPQVEVAFADQFDNVVTSASGSIQVALLPNSANASMPVTTRGPVNGVAAFTQLKVSASGPATGLVLHATSADVPSVDSVPFDIVYGQPSALSTLTVAPSTALADGLEELTITATLRNAAGIPLPAYNVSIASSGSGNVLFPTASGVTDAQGKFIISISSTVAEMKVITLVSGSLTLMTTAQFFAAACELRLPGLPSRLAQAPITALTAADLDGDGHLDVALAELGQLAVMRGNGTGHFHAPVNYVTSTGSGIDWIDANDLDNDGDTDLVLGDRYQGVFIMANNGVGAFTKTLIATSPYSALAVVAGNFDADTIPDLAVRSDDDVWIYRGNGDASFMTPMRYPLNAQPYSVSAGSIASEDLDGDGDLDLFTTGAGYRSVLLGSASGTFQVLPAVYDGPASGSGLHAIADFDGDGDLDIVCAVSFLRGNGNGTFASPVSIGRMFEGAQGARAADLNGDGKLDVILASSDNETGGIEVLHGNGDGTFALATLSVATGLVRSLTLGDFNEDGRSDVAFSEGGNSSAGRLSVLLGETNGTFPGARHRGDIVGSGRAAFFGLTGDFDANGTLDFVAMNQVSKKIGVQLSGSDGTLTAMPTVSATSMYEGVARDFDGDTKLDLLGLSGGGLTWFRGNGDGTLQTGVDSAIPAGATRSIAAADLDNDGHDDVATAYYIGASVAVAFGSGTGSWGSPLQLATGSHPNQVQIADLNADGLRDLVVANHNGASISVIVNQGNRMFAAAVTYAGTGKPDSTAIADFDGDGKLDIIAANSEGQTITVFKGNGDATFATGVHYDFGTPASYVRAADMDGDGNMDLVYLGYGVQVLRGLGNGTFLPALMFDCDAGREPVIADFDGNGAPDVMVPEFDFSAAAGFVLALNGGCH
jgi:hypothetical protein